MQPDFIHPGLIKPIPYRDPEKNRGGVSSVTPPTVKVQSDSVLKVQPYPVVKVQSDSVLKVQLDHVVKVQPDSVLKVQQDPVVKVQSDPVVKVQLYRVVKVQPSMPTKSIVRPNSVLENVLVFSSH